MNIDKIVFFSYLYEPALTIFYLHEENIAILVRPSGHIDRLEFGNDLTFKQLIINMKNDDIIYDDIGRFC